MSQWGDECGVQGPNGAASSRLKDSERTHGGSLGQPGRLGRAHTCRIEGMGLLSRLLVPEAVERVCRRKAEAPRGRKTTEVARAVRIEAFRKRCREGSWVGARRQSVCVSKGDEVTLAPDVTACWTTGLLGLL